MLSVERVLRLGAQDDRVVAGAIVGSLAVDGGDRVLRPRPDLRRRRPCSGRRRARRLDAHAGRRARRGAARRARARADHLPGVPAAGRAAAGSLDDAGGSVPSRRATVPARVRPDGSGRVRDGHRGPLHPHAGGGGGHLRVGRDLRAPRARVHRTRAWPAGRALRRRRARPRALARVSPRGAARGAGSRLRRSLRPRPSLDSRTPTSVRSRPGRSGPLSPPRVRCASRARAWRRDVPHAQVVAERLAELALTSPMDPDATRRQPTRFSYTSQPRTVRMPSRS